MAAALLTASAAPAAQAQQASFDSIARLLGLRPLQSTGAPRYWEVRIWTTGFVDAESGLGSLVRFWGQGADLLRGEYITYWRRDAGHAVDSIRRAAGDTVTWRDDVVRRLACQRTRRIRDLEWCERAPAPDSVWRRVFDSFEGNDGWTLGDESAAPPPRRWVLDGNGWVVELVRDGAYHTYGYQNADSSEGGPRAKAAALERGVFCALDPALNLCNVGGHARAGPPPRGRSDVPAERYTLSVDDLIRRNARPAVYLSLTTVRKFGCTGFRIDGTLARQAGTVLVNVGGIREIEVCAKGFGPASFWHPLDLAPGAYTLVIQSGQRRATYELTVTDTSVALAGADKGWVAPDTRTKWRVPPSSFALACSQGHSAPEQVAPFCAEVMRWVRKLPGVSEFAFPKGGVNSYHRGPDDPAYHFLTYQDSTVLLRVRDCVAAIHRQIRTAVGVSVMIQRWDGVQWLAWAEGSLSGPHTQVPAAVTRVRECAGA